MLSAVIPVFNEAESLPALHRELDEVARANGYELEILFVDDGSRDESWKVIDSLAQADPRVRGVRLRRNFGKAAALTAGFDQARGDIIFTLDADLQDDPHEIPRFLAELNTGLDCVSGWKQVRHDPWHKVLPSRVFNWMVGFMTGVKLHDHNCGFKCYRSEIFSEVRIYGELHRFVPVLAAARGWKVGEVVINHRPRKFGVSKYGLTRIVKGFLDLSTVFFLTGYSRRPQHLLGTLGLLSFVTGFVILAYLSGLWIYAQQYPDANVTPLHQRPLALYALGVLLLGAQLISTGILAEMFAAGQAKHETGYSIKAECGVRRDGSPREPRA